MDLAAWLGAVAGLVGIPFLATQFIQARRVAYGQFLHELDKDYRSIHKDFGIIYKGDGATGTELDETKVLFTMAFFEKVKFLLDSKVVDMKAIDQMFCYRFFAFVDTPGVRQIMSKYDEFTCVPALLEQWTAFRRKNKLSPPNRLLGSDPA